MQDLRFSSQDRMSASSNDYYETRFERMRKSKSFTAGLVAFSIIVFGSIVIYAYNQGKSASTDVSGDTPLITASADPFKVRPGDEGGESIAYKDSLAYQQIEPAGGEDVENLLPPPENAMEKPAVEMNEQELSAQSKEIMNTPQAEQYAVAANAFEDPANGTKYDAIAPAAGNAEAEPQESATTQSEPAQPVEAKTADNADMVVAAVEQPSAEAAKQEAAATASANTAPITGDYRVQLASFTAKADAEAAWTKMQKKYAPHLDNVTMGVTRADLGAKGIYYRLNVVNLSKNSATSLCDTIKNINPEGCLVAK